MVRARRVDDHAVQPAVGLGEAAEVGRRLAPPRLLHHRAEPAQLLDLRIRHLRRATRSTKRKSARRRPNSTPTNLALSNANYTLASASGSVTVNPLAVSLTGTETYNGSTAVAGSDDWIVIPAITSKTKAGYVEAIATLGG